MTAPTHRSVLTLNRPTSGEHGCILIQREARDRTVMSRKEAASNGRRNEGNAREKENARSSEKFAVSRSGRRVRARYMPNGSLVCP